jgi:hypothetical protein
MDAGVVLLSEQNLQPVESVGEAFEPFAYREFFLFHK